jgi:hypothetical protein
MNCPRCKGNGEIDCRMHPDRPIGEDDYIVLCVYCGGTGYLDQE